MATLTSPPQVVVMGVAGAGKTVVGSALATALAVPFADGDDLHPQHNIDKMASGQPLDDEDRRPWLEAIGTWLTTHRDRGGVVACSALRRAYRDQLRQACAEVTFVHLSGDRDIVATRVAARHGHFMPTSLVDSQFRTLEPLGPDEDGITLDLSRPVDDLVARALQWLSHR